MNKYSRYFFVFLMMVLSGCNEEEKVGEVVSKLNTLRSNAEKMASLTPYKKDQFEAFGAYFGEIGSLAFQLTENQQMSGAMNKYLSKHSIEAMCSATFMKASIWKLIVKNCTKNEFFLCSEEVREYQGLLKSVRAKLSEQNQIAFTNGASCKASLDETIR